ncbi:acid protease [Laetiporus sulphureus 93-53]|uniref:Acid protease n=1 Tax=Laetiporus sulphureus 93-53 TaxID=1314785 RepID=A0A165H959_9APHY|nr:acid protease [Laetiporus sulphureus 93-53]KZT11415.1 acid protease [Laetiporus sulphureus 93-53]
MAASGASIPLTRVPRRPGSSPQGFNSAVSLSNANEFAYLVPVSIGGQNFMVLLDTGSSDLWVVSSNCVGQDCQGITKYNATASSSLSLTNASFHLQYLLGSVSGAIGTDTVALGSYEISSQVLALANATDGLDLSGTGYSGILGLSFPADASIPSTDGRTLAENVFASLNESNRFFAFQLGRNQTGSSFTIGQLDPAFANSSSDMNYLPVSSAGGSSYNYWKVPLQSLTINSTTFNLSKSDVQGSATPIAILDSGTTLILGPSSDVQRFWESVGDARNTDAGWQVRCNRAVVVGFILGDAGNQKEYVIDPSDISWEQGSGKQDGWCMGGIQANDGVFSGDWLLGDTFLRNVYVTHHAAIASRPPMVGLRGLTDPVSSLAHFRQDRGNDSTSPGQIYAQPYQSHDLTGADICGIATACGFVFGLFLTFIVHSCLQRYDRKRVAY